MLVEPRFEVATTMQCDNCGKKEAVIQLTQVENNEMRILHLCESCAAERGVEPQTPVPNAPLADFLAQIGKGVSDELARGKCPSCGLTAAQLRQSGRLGCATCYAHYDSHLRNLLRRLHGGTKHVGKMILPVDADETDRTAHLQSLRRSLDRAVAAEDFEHAAALRDQLRKLEVRE